MLKAIYKLPKFLIAMIAIGIAIAFILIENPPYSICDSQTNHFKQLQAGILYPDGSDFHKEKSILKRKKNICQKENAPGSCYEYFAYLRTLLKDFRVLSEDCKAVIFSSIQVKQTLGEALALMTALAWREELLSGKLNELNWFSHLDMHLFCRIKAEYISEYGQSAYQQLENQIISQLPSDKKNPKLILKWSILSKDCREYQ